MSDERGTEQHWMIDAIEEGVASIELPEGQMIQLPVALLPKGAKQGQLLCVTLHVDAAATQVAQRKSAEQAKRGSDASRKNDPGGDITL